MSDQGFSDVPLNFLTKLGASRDVMAKAEVKGQEIARERGDGSMRNEPLPPPNYNGGMGDATSSQLSELKTRFASTIAPEGGEMEYLTEAQAQQLRNGIPQPMSPQPMSPQGQGQSQEQLLQQLHAMEAARPQMAPRPAVEAPITETLIDNSRMPEAVKRAMKNYPISMEVPVVEVSANIANNPRMMELMNLQQPQYQQPAPQYQQPTPQYQQPAPQRQQLNEQGKTVIRTSEATIRKMVQEEIMGIMTKNIREQAIADTINTLKRKGIIP